MEPICRYFARNVAFEPTGAVERDQRVYKQFLGVIKLLATNAKLAAKAFLAKKYADFDPIVHDNCCQIRALCVILSAGNDALLREAAAMYRTAEGVERALNRMMNQAPPDHRVTLEEAMSGPLALTATPGLIYLLQTYFLTAAKTFRMHPDGTETATIDYQRLRQLLSRQINSDTLQEMVDYCQIRLAEASVPFIQSQARLLHDPATETRLQEVRMTRSRPCTYAFYNFRTVLERIRAENILLLVKHYDHPAGIFYRGLTPIADAGALNPDAPVFVIEGFLPPSVQGQDAFREYMRDIPLMPLALANVAQHPQFSSEDVRGENHMQMMLYRAVGEALGCNYANPRTYTIVHTHAGTVGAERARLQ